MGEGLTGLDIGCNMGYTSHMLARQGVSMMGVDFDDHHLSIASALNSTYGLNVEFVNRRFETIDISRKFDIVVMLTVLYHTLDRDRAEAVNIVERIDALGPAVMLWESGDRPDVEIDLITSNSGLTEFLSLGQTHATGKRRILGVFLRPGVPVSEYLRARYIREMVNEFSTGRAASSLAIHKH
jgi:SAM-dependent methyltransferase